LWLARGRTLPPNTRTQDGSPDAGGDHGKEAHLTTDLRAATADLPATVVRVLDEFVAAARDAFGDALEALVLYGSAAEGRLRRTSDVNVAVVLKRFDLERAQRLADVLRLAHAAVGLAPMFITVEELPAASTAFAAKFADIRRRRRVLYGSDPFASLAVPRAAEIARLRQVLLNLVLRWRAASARDAGREDRLTAVVADSAGPLRSCAGTILELQDRRAANSRAALEIVAAELEDGYGEALARLSEARETRTLPPGVAAATLGRLIDLAASLRRRVDGLAG
jgi:predicted nucleotidyltransferase